MHRFNLFLLDCEIRSFGCVLFTLTTVVEQPTGDFLVTQRAGIRPANSIYWLLQSIIVNRRPGGCVLVIFDCRYPNKPVKKTRGRCVWNTKPDKHNPLWLTNIRHESDCRGHEPGFYKHVWLQSARDSAPQPKDHLHNLLRSALVWYEFHENRDSCCL